MIDTLHIKNFLVFEDIEIKGLRRVNLIAGKNNSGKTALLEALRILESNAESTVINNILKRRGQYKPSNEEIYNSLLNRNYLVTNTDHEAAFFINEKKIGRSVHSSTFKINSKTLNPNDSPDFPADKAVYVPFGNDLTNAKELWSKIALTPMEKRVLSIMKETIEEGLERIDLSSEPPRVLLNGEELPVPLQSLGEGVQRMLLIAMALVSAKGKVLLIDEFEAGLHHSVQQKLWDLVFHYAKELDVQVFATTHSEDAINSFYYIASRPENEREAAFLRLQYDRSGKQEAQVYDMERLGDSIKMNLETR